MAFASYFIWFSIAVLSFLLGLTLVPLYVLVGFFSGIIVCNISIYATIRTGFNKRFKDPSLTLLQMLVATFWTMVFLYYSDSSRSTVLLLYLVVFVFGLFRLKIWEFLFLSLFAVVNYAAIIFLLYITHPEAINIKTDVLNIVILATVLPWFSLVGGYITKLKTKISNALSTIEQMTDNIQDVIFVLDMNLNYTYVSPSVKNLRGYEPEEVLKQTLFDALTPSSADIAMRTLSEFMDLEKSGHKGTIFRTLQLEIRRQDGATVWTETKVSFIRDKNQRPVRILGVIRDITERKKIEQKLRDEEQRFRTLTEQSSDIIVLVNREGVIIYENPAVDRILGLNHEERVGKNILENLHPDDLHTVTKAFNALIGDKNASPQRDEIRLRHVDGSWRNFEVVGSNLTQENIVQAIIINLRDITERKRAEEKLKQTLDSLKNAVGTTIQVLVSALESRDPYTAGHQTRSANLACAIATELGLAQDKIEGIRLAGSIHDIGKLSIPAEILTKPTKLTNLEFSLIKEHSQCGYEMLKNVESPWPLAEIIHQHHERMDGSGYPGSLKGDAIILEACIIAVADVVEAMASHRPYRASLGIEAALAEIEKNKGILYDVAVADACLRLFREKGYQLT
jgi:PAS domain S-box-containing protein